MKSNKQNRTRTNLVRQIALLEECLAENQKEHEAARAYHHSELVETSQTNATLAVREAVRRLAEEDFEVAERLAAVAWFYADFARAILEAEFTEHQLGEDEYLDLVPSRQNIKNKMTNLMTELKLLLQKKYDAVEQAGGI